MLDFLFSRGRKRYGGYELLEEIARGGMSRVWKAKKPDDDKIVAVKVLTPESVETMARFKEVFETEEGEIALRLSHPNVVRTYRLRPRGQGRLLHRDGVRRRAEPGDAGGAGVPPHSPGALRAGAADGGGAPYIHEQGLIHRDFCPKNVLYGEDNVAKIIDFGLCVPAFLQERTFMARAGTASYMAPEQVRSQPLDVRADVYAYGMSAFEVLTNRRPFPRTQSRSRRMQDHLNIKPLRLRQVCPTCPRNSKTPSRNVLQKTGICAISLWTRP